MSAGTGPGTGRRGRGRTRMRLGTRTGIISSGTLASTWTSTAPVPSALMAIFYCFNTCICVGHINHTNHLSNPQTNFGNITLFINLHHTNKV